MPIPVPCGGIRADRFQPEIHSVRRCRLQPTLPGVCEGWRLLQNNLSGFPRFCLQHRAHPFFVFAGDGKAGVGNGDGIGGYEGSVSCIDQI